VFLLFLKDGLEAPFLRAPSERLREKPAKYQDGIDGDSRHSSVRYLEGNAQAQTGDACDY
jgi:hypothetical protein